MHMHTVLQHQLPNIITRSTLIITTIAAKPDRFYHHHQVVSFAFSWNVENAINIYTNPTPALFHAIPILSYQSNIKTSLGRYVLDLFTMQFNFMMSLILCSFCVISARCHMQSHCITLHLLREILKQLRL